jgi:hypothetical protein
MRRTTRTETMTGLARVDGADRPVTLQLDADLPGIVTPWADIFTGHDGRRLHAAASTDQAVGDLG